MAMNSTRAPQPGANKPPAGSLPPEAGRHAAAAAPAASKEAQKISGYGLPCAKCRLYYPADLDSCPTCHHSERVSPIPPKVPLHATQAAPEAPPDTTVVEQEREEFLRQFKSQLMEAHAEVVNAPGAICTVGEHLAEEPARAEVCKACYERLQERLDVCEAALHLDLKEAAQIIYDAVWADPSDPSKTYQNAANALLTELRKRAGMNSLLGPFHPLPH
jgi:hypothetical protein